MTLRFTCPHCGLATDVADEYQGRSGPCARCGKTVTVPAAEATPFAPPPDLGQDPLVRMLMPVGRSGLAIAAGYAGLFSLLCFPAPIALVLGILAIRDLKKHPEKHGMGRAIFGLVAGIIGTLGLVIAVIAGIVDR